ncbi:hypothetical protein M0811_01032 [Anaeramoeba ignava]|uniref:Uncharacterized protein n=1 Tax=Anaeramoeba ignava TaxID=1746090 RepID=A0A9Q0LK60_ANAIG|nr:hypothetical protein M0811_01032 [Anaeramoeba ignava]
MSFFGFFRSIKFEIILHLINIFSWFFSIGGVGSFGKTDSKYYLLFIFTTLFSLLLSVIFLILKKVDSLNDIARKNIEVSIVVVILLSLFGAHVVYNEQCLILQDLKKSCKTASRVYVFGVAISCIVLILELFASVYSDEVESGFGNMQKPQKIEDQEYYPETRTQSQPQPQPENTSEIITTTQKPDQQFQVPDDVTTSDTNSNTSDTTNTSDSNSDSGIPQKKESYV